MKGHKGSMFVFVLLGIWTLAGCISFHPLGMSNAEWDALSPEQKIEAREKQAQITARKKQAAAQQAAAAQSATASRYENARYGDIITVSITGGTMEIYGKRHEYEPIAFDLIRGEAKEIEIVRKGKSHAKNTAMVRLSEDGRTFYFDDKQSSKLVLVDQGWDRGKTYRIKELKNHNADPRDIMVRIHYRPMGDGGGDTIIIVR